MSTQAATEFLTNSFAPWVLALDPVIVSVSQDSACLRIPLGPNIARVGGIASGQALAALADTAMAVACFGALEGSGPVATTNLDTQFLRPATGDAVRAEAEVVRVGKSLIFTRVTLIAEPSDKPVATATATFFRPA